MHGGNQEFVDFVQEELDNGINMWSPEERATVLAEGFDTMIQNPGTAHPLVRDIVAAWNAYEHEGTA